MRAGIDLGTTNSIVATLDDSTGEIRILTEDEGLNYVPSVICFCDDGMVHFGARAKEMQSNMEGTCISTFKLGMGDNHDMAIWNNSGYTAEKLSAMLIGYLIRNAEQRTNGEAITEVVITCPAYFNEYQRTATIRAAEANGLRVLRIINEPTAAAVHYGYQSDIDKTLLVYDLGGGTFDATVIRVSGGEINVIATAGDHNLGGRDWDAMIVNRVCSEFADKYGYNLRDDPHVKNYLNVMAEECKTILTEEEVSRVSVTYRGHTLNVDIHREWLEDSSSYLLEATENIIEGMMTESNLEWSMIDEVLLVGGSTHMPMVKAYVEEVSGKLVSMADDSDLAVAMGAAAIAGQIGRSNDSYRMMTVSDVTSHTLGALTREKDGSSYYNKFMIKRNSKIPASTTSPFYIPCKNNTDRAEVYILQGESSNPLDCNVLSKVTITGFVNTGDGVVLDIKYSYDENGKVHVDAYRDGEELNTVSEPVTGDVSWMGRPPGEMDSENHPHNNIVICVDVSRSMERHGALETAKNCIRDFIRKMDSSVSYAVVAYGDRSQTMLELTDNSYNVVTEISRLRPNMLGRGTRASPFVEAKRILDDRIGNNIIFILTDGKWENQSKVEAEVTNCINKGMCIVSIGLGDADMPFLDKISNTSEGAIFTTISEMSNAFNTIAIAIRSGRLGLRLNP